jgi:hypothetical protein
VKEPVEKRCLPLDVLIVAKTDALAQFADERGFRWQMRLAGAIPRNLTRFEWFLDMNEGAGLNR